MIILNVEVILRDNVLFLGIWGVVKLVESEKLECGVDKGDMRERKKKGDWKKKPWNMNVKLWSF